MFRTLRLAVCRTLILPVIAVIDTIAQLPCPNTSTAISTGIQTVPMTGGPVGPTGALQLVPLVRTGSLAITEHTAVPWEAGTGQSYWLVTVSAPGQAALV